MALQTKVYSKTSNTFTLELTLVENSTSTAGNTSSVSYTLKLKSTTKNFAQYGVGATVSLDGKKVATRDRYSASKVTLGTYSSVTLLTGTAAIAHDSDGGKSMSLAYTLDMASASYTPGPMSGSGTMALTHIPRGATITSAPNFTDEDSPTVKISNPAGGTLQVGIYKTDASTVLAAYRSMTGTSYTFQFTNAEREALQKVSTTSNTATVRFYVKSVVAGQTFYNYSAKTLTIRNPAPTLSPTAEDVNPDTLALTGESGNLVKYHSQVWVQTGATAVKGATLARQSVTCGSLTLTGDGTLEGVEVGNIVISATDSRGNTTTQVVEKQLVGYVHLSCTIGQGVPDASGRYDLEVTGASYYGSFGAVDNTLTVEYRYRVQGADTWGDWVELEDILPMGFTYLARGTVEGLDYQTAYEFQARATDVLEQVESGVRVVKAQPVFDWSETDFNFNVPVTVQGYNLLGVAKALSDSYNLDLEITPGENYSSVTGAATLMGCNLFLILTATRKSASGVGNITNDQVCTVHINHGGKLKRIAAVGFSTANTGGPGNLSVTSVSDGETSSSLSVELASTAQVLSTYNVRASIPVLLDLSKY